MKWLSLQIITMHGIYGNCAQIEFFEIFYWIVTSLRVIRWRLQNQNPSWAKWCDCTFAFMCSEASCRRLYLFAVMHALVVAAASLRLNVAFRLIMLSFCLFCGGEQCLLAAAQLDFFSWYNQAPRHRPTSNNWCCFCLMN